MFDKELMKHSNNLQIHIHNFFKESNISGYELY
jgi:hypothetical protein